MFTSFLLGFFFLNHCDAFHSGRTLLQNKRQIIRNTIEIDSDHPSLIAKTLSQEFYKYGIPQSYDDFIRQLTNHEVESVSLISKNNEIVQQFSTGFLRVREEQTEKEQSHLIELQPSHLTIPKGYKLRISISAAAWPAIGVNSGSVNKGHGSPTSAHKIITLNFNLNKTIMKIKPFFK